MNSVKDVCSMRTARPILQTGSSPLFIKRRTVREDTLNNSPASAVVYASLVINFGSPLSEIRGGYPPLEATLDISVVKELAPLVVG